MRALGFIFFYLLVLPAGAQVFNITGYGAVGDGVTINTTAIQNAINACNAAGGGIVQVPAGNFMTGTVILKSNVTINLAQGATISGSTSFSDYPVIIPQIRSYADNYPQRSVFYAENQSNIGITGQGTFNGNGISTNFITTHDTAPLGFRFISCTHVLYDGDTLKNSAFWMMHNFNCDSLTIKNLHIINQAWGNNDGIDIDGCRNVLVDSCTADCNDDAIVIKTCSTIGNDNIEIRNCTVGTYSRAIKIGTETFGPTANVYIHDCNVIFSTAGFYGSNHPALGGINLSSVDGGSMQNILIKNITMTGVNTPIFIRLGNEGITYDTLPVPPTGFVNNIELDSITATASNDTTSSITGVPGYPLQNITLNNVNVTYPGGWPALDSNFVVPENVNGQPQATIFGDTLPAGGLYSRHVVSMQLQNVCFTALKPDGRPDFYLDDITYLDTAGLCGSVYDTAVVTGLNTVDLGNGIAVYPNPVTSGGVVLKCNAGLIGATLKLMDAQGQVLQLISPVAEMQTIEMDKFSAGIYLLLLVKNHVVVSRKIVKL